MSDPIDRACKPKLRQIKSELSSITSGFEEKERSIYSRSYESHVTILYAFAKSSLNVTRLISFLGLPDPRKARSILGVANSRVLKNRLRGQAPVRGDGPEAGLCVRSE